VTKKKSRRSQGTGSIYLRPDGRWCGIIDLGWSNGKRRRRFVYGKSESEVVGKLQEVQRQILTGEPVLTGRETLEEYLECWLLDTLPGTVKPSTERSYGAVVRQHIIPELGRIQLRKLQPAHVRRLLRQKATQPRRDTKYADKRGEPLSPRMVQYIHAVLRRALEQARMDELVTRNVAALVKPPKLPRYEWQYLTPQQARQLLDAVREDRLYAIYAVAVAIGLRRGEVLGLRWQDVDLDEGTLYVRRSLQRLNGQLVLGDTKTDKSYRRVPLPRVCIASLREHRERQEKERAEALVWLDEWGLVFTTKHGTPIEPRNLLRHFQVQCEKLGLPKLRFHDLRHTCASLLLAQGVDLPIVKETLGHAAIATTMIQRKAADRMDDLLGSQLGSQSREDGDDDGLLVRRRGADQRIYRWSGAVSNRRPRDFQSRALPTELPDRWGRPG
jgi:integrase